jgi:hypothetical protein
MLDDSETTVGRARGSNFLPRAAEHVGVVLNASLLVLLDRPLRDSFMLHITEKNDRGPLQLRYIAAGCVFEQRWTRLIRHNR